MCCLQHVIVDVDIVSLEGTDTTNLTIIVEKYIKITFYYSTKSAFNIFPTVFSNIYASLLAEKAEVQLPHTQKSRLYFMFLKSPPTKAAR